MTITFDKVLVTDKQKSMFEELHNVTQEQAEEVAIHYAKFYCTEARVYRHGFELARFEFVDGAVVKGEHES